jgi:hypothetical protein
MKNKAHYALLTLGVILPLACAIGFSPGCAALAPGADPLVVRVEQAESTGKAVLDLVVHVESANFTFYQSNAPGFVTFAEWLKVPQSVPAGATNGTLPRGLALVWSLDQTKMAYKQGLATSNVLTTALGTFAAAVNQASAWLTVTTNTPH